MALGGAPLNLLNYDGLVTATAEYLNREDLADQIPLFIKMATAQFNRELRFRDMQVRAYTTSNAENVELPLDWLEHYSLTLTNPTSSGWPLRYMSERETNDIKAGRHGTGGSPAGYTVIGNAIELVPAPGGDVELRMVYYARIPDIGPNAIPELGLVTSNWLLLKSPDLYLYSTLLQAEPYLNNDARLPLWAQLRTAIVEAMRLESEAALRPRSQLTAVARAF
jgi:hypothetical protein